METPIIIAIVAVLVLAALVAIGLVLARRRRVSLGAKQDKAIEQADKGGYQTKAGFDFSQGGGDTATLEREPVPAPTPTEPVEKSTSSMSLVREG